MLILCFGLVLISSCIDRIEIKVPDSYSSQLVVDGVITDEPGPYTVRLTSSTKVESFLLFHRDFTTGATVTIYDNGGNSELLTEISPGVYQTKENGIRGVIGREYYLRIITSNGKVYESIPDLLSPVGKLDSLYFERESFLPLNDQERYGFRFYIDAQSPPDNDTYVRWKFTGVYEINAYPELYGRKIGQTDCVRGPLPCSGLIFSGAGYQRLEDCSCCKCWVTRYEDQPHVSDNQFVYNGEAKKVEIGYVPVEFFPFQAGKYRVEVKQMSLSRIAYDYWRIIQSQKEGAASLFQPPTGKIRSNVFSRDGSQEVQGLFYASAVATKQVYLTSKDVQDIKLRIPFWDCETGLIAEDCRKAFLFSSATKPADWKY